jgi:hypothetical protein
MYVHFKNPLSREKVINSGLLRFVSFLYNRNYDKNNKMKLLVSSKLSIISYFPRLNPLEAFLFYSISLQFFLISNEGRLFSLYVDTLSEEAKRILLLCMKLALDFSGL